MTFSYKIIVKETKSFQGECKDDAAFSLIFDDVVKQYAKDMVMGEFHEENYVHALCYIPEKEKYLSCFYYNDFDDYEDEIELGSESWMKMMR